MDLEDVALYEVAMLGQDADQFFKTHLGEFVLHRCHEEIQYATDKLREADPNQPANIIHWQNMIKVAASIPRWFNSLIKEGRQAETILEERKSIE